MNYMIWREKDSRDITGLVISELPPITKPNMRIAETVVDGVDGSIIEELGYEAYDKPLVIGLTQKADINEVIEYFTGAGEVVFSNEPDKYYKAQIIGQIDYTRLARFKVATVTFRVQPFKYEYEEEVTDATQIVEGNTIAFNKTDDITITVLGVEGKCSQDGIPSPDTPIEIKSIGKYNETTGKYEISFMSGSDTITMKLDKPLRSVGEIKDIAYIKNNKLYVERKVGSKIFNGTENWEGLVTQGFYCTTNGYNIKNKSKVLCNRYVNHFSNDFTDYDYGIGMLYDGVQHLYIRNKDITTKEELITELGTNNIEVVYELANQYVEECGDLPILSVTKGINNISNSRNAYMFIKYISDNITITNGGNYVSKPIMEVMGSGTVAVAVNGNLLFRYTFPDDENTVIIDSQKQDAYLGTVLKNRNMVGEFPVLNVGENTITWEGIVSSVKISSKSRWI